MKQTELSHVQISQQGTSAIPNIFYAVFSLQLLYTEHYHNIYTELQIFSFFSIRHFDCTVNNLTYQ